MWHVSSRSGVMATLRTAIHLLLTYLLTPRSSQRRQRLVRRQIAVIARNYVHWLSAVSDNLTQSVAYRPTLFLKLLGFTFLQACISSLLLLRFNISRSRIFPFARSQRPYSMAERRGSPTCRVAVAVGS